MAADLKLLGQMCLINFQKTLDELHQKQLYVIVNDKTATKQQIKDNMHTFFQSAGADALTKFNKIRRKVESQHSDSLLKVKDFEATMSPDAKMFLEKAREIKNDFSITPGKEKRQLCELFAKLPEATKEEIKNLGKLFVA